MPWQQEISIKAILGDTYNIGAKMEKDLNEIASELQKYIDKLSETLMVDISKELREANKQYRDLIALAGDLNTRLSINK